MAKSRSKDSSKRPRARSGTSHQFTDIWSGTKSLERTVFEDFARRTLKTCPCHVCLLITGQDTQAKLSRIVTQNLDKASTQEKIGASEQV